MSAPVTNAHLESSVERALVRGVRRAGGRVEKLVAASRVGVPDRLVMLPGGRVVFVELKQAGANPSPAQRVWHDRARALGVTVVVLRGRADVDRWLNTLTTEGTES